MPITALELVNNQLPTLHLNHTVAEALDTMRAYHLSQIALVIDELVEGIIYLEDIENDEPERLITKADVREHGPFVLGSAHLLTALCTMVNSELTIIPTTNEYLQYTGCIRAEALIEAATDTLGLGGHGSTIVIRVPTRSYSLSEIARICESNDAKILSLGAKHDAANDTFTITLQLDIKPLNAVLATFERYEYEVIASFGELGNDDFLDDRYKLLMNYINM